MRIPAVRLGVDRGPAVLGGVRRGRDDGVRVARGADHAPEHEALVPHRELARVTEIVGVDVHVHAARGGQGDRREGEGPGAVPGRLVREAVEQLDVDFIVAVRGGGRPVEDIEETVRGVLILGEAPGLDGADRRPAWGRDRERDLVSSLVPPREEQDVVPRPRFPGVRGNDHGHRPRRRGGHGDQAVEVVLTRVSSRRDDDLPGSGQPVQQQIHVGRAVVRTRLRPQAQVHHGLFPKGCGLLEDVVDPIHDVGRRKRGLHHAEVGFRRHADVGKGGLAVAGRAAVPRRDSRDVRSVPLDVDLRRRRRVDRGREPLGAVAVSRRGRRSRSGLVPERHQPGRAVGLLEISVRVVNARIHDSHEHAGAGLSRKGRRCHGPHGGDAHVDRAQVQIWLAPLGYLHALDSRQIEKGGQER